MYIYVISHCNRYKWICILSPIILLVCESARMGEKSKSFSNWEILFCFPFEPVRRPIRESRDTETGPGTPRDLTDDPLPFPLLFPVFRNSSFSLTRALASVQFPLSLRSTSSLALPSFRQSRIFTRFWPVRTTESSVELLWVRGLLSFGRVPSFLRFTVYPTTTLILPSSPSPFPS